MCCVCVSCVCLVTPSYISTPFYTFSNQIWSTEMRRLFKEHGITIKTQALFAVENNTMKISSYLGNVWKTLDADYKSVFFAAAKAEKSLHQQLYPTYNYAPSKKMRLKKPSMLLNERCFFPDQAASYLYLAVNVSEANQDTQADCFPLHSEVRFSHCYPDDLCQDGHRLAAFPQYL